MDRILVIHYWAAGGSETLDDNSIEYRFIKLAKTRMLMLFFSDIMILMFDIYVLITTWALC